MDCCSDDVKKLQDLVTATLKEIEATKRRRTSLAYSQNADTATDRSPTKPLPVVSCTILHVFAVRKRKDGTVTQSLLIALPNDPSRPVLLEGDSTQIESLIIDSYNDNGISFVRRLPVLCELRNVPRVAVPPFQQVMGSFKYVMTPASEVIIGARAPEPQPGSPPPFDLVSSCIELEALTGNTKNRGKLNIFGQVMKVSFNESGHELVLVNHCESACNMPPLMCVGAMYRLVKAAV